MIFNKSLSVKCLIFEKLDSQFDDFMSGKTLIKHEYKITKNVL